MVLMARPGGEWHCQDRSKAPQLSRCYTRRNGGLVRFFCISLVSVDFRCSLLLRPLCGHKPAAPLHHHLPGSNATVFHPSPSPIPNSHRSSATQSVHPFSLLPRSTPAWVLEGPYHDPSGQSSVTHSNERPCPQQLPRAHGGLNTLTARPLKGKMVGEDPEVPQPAPGTDDPKHHLWCAARSFW